jgi:peptidoglycan/xylan/chitin deacetylase (PgdA/CDA1 family)
MRAGLEHRVGRAAKRLRGWMPHAPRPAILMYHRIAEDSFDPWGTAVTPAHFAEHLAWLISYRTVLALPEFAAKHAERKLPANALALTFDDGYSCSAEIAAPMLERFRAPATIFLPTDAIENDGQFWWDELEHIVLEHEGRRFSLGGEEIHLGDKRRNDRRWRPGSPPRTARQRAYHDIQRRLVTKKPTDLQDSLAELRRQSKPAGADRSPKRPMKPEEARQIANELISFGSHSRNHPWLTSLAPAEQAEEIRGSFDRCRAITGSRPAAFAYPFGAFDQQCERVAEEAGYDCACSTETAAVEPDSRLFALPRVQVGNWPARRLARVLREL